MFCIKRKRRDIHSLLSYFSCIDCKYKHDNEVIKIGRSNIRIFYFDYCPYNGDNNVIYPSRRKNIMFKDILVNHRKDYIFLWLDKSDNFSKYYQDFEFFIKKGLEIIIVI